MEIRCGPFLFTSKFDGGNMLNVERVMRDEPPVNGAQPSSGDTQQPTQSVSAAAAGQQDKLGAVNGQYFVKPDYEFNVTTMPDCYNTQYVNSNRTWFHFAVRGNLPSKLIRLNIVNMNKQSRLYSQGYVPIWRVLPGKPKWERLRERVTFETDKQDRFVMSFQFRYPEYRNCTVYFAFAYPFSYGELQAQLDSLDRQYSTRFDYERRFEYVMRRKASVAEQATSGTQNVTESELTSADGQMEVDEMNQEEQPTSHRVALSDDAIYFCRELLTFTLEKRRVDLVTISDCCNITDDYEPRFDERLFPGVNLAGGRRKCRLFKNKRVVFISSRVHPGETPSSFVFNGALNFLLRENDPRARELRRRFVFKLVPFLNADGVFHGHYRTDTRGVNLNRMYLDPDPELYPTIFAAKSLLVNYHSLYRVVEPSVSVEQATEGQVTVKSTPRNVIIVRDCSSLSTANDQSSFSLALESDSLELSAVDDGEPGNEGSSDDDDAASEYGVLDAANCTTPQLCSPELLRIPPEQSGVFLYVDLHGHCSKRGCFVYGNAIDDESRMVDNLLYAKLLALNSAHFDFSACNFSVRNMYARDKRDGLSKEGSGRVALFKHLGITHSYTLECNYNSGRTINYVSAATGDDGRATPPISGFPPKYTPEHYEEVGRAMLVSILDLLDANCWSRIPTSEYLSTAAVRDWCRSFLKHLRTGSPIKWSAAQFVKTSSNGQERFLKNRVNMRKQSNAPNSSNKPGVMLQAASLSQQSSANGSLHTCNSLPLIGAARSLATKKQSHPFASGNRNSSNARSNQVTAAAYSNAVHVKTQRNHTVSTDVRTFPNVNGANAGNTLKKSDSTPAIPSAAQSHAIMRFKWHRLSDASSGKGIASVSLSLPDNSQSLTQTNATESTASSVKTRNGGEQRNLVATGRRLIPSKVSVIAVERGAENELSNDDVKSLLGSLSVRERTVATTTTTTTTTTVRHGTKANFAKATLSVLNSRRAAQVYAMSTVAAAKRAESGSQKTSKTKSMRSHSQSPSSDYTK